MLEPHEVEELNQKFAHSEPAQAAAAKLAERMSRGEERVSFVLVDVTEWDSGYG